MLGRRCIRDIFGYCKLKGVEKCVFSDKLPNHPSSNNCNYHQTQTEMMIERGQKDILDSTHRIKGRIKWRKAK